MARVYASLAKISPRVTTAIAAWLIGLGTREMAVIVHNVNALQILMDVIRRRETASAAQKEQLEDSVKNVMKQIIMWAITAYVFTSFLWDISKCCVKIFATKNGNRLQL